jgi:hypothetical protein
MLGIGLASFDLDDRERSRRVLNQKLIFAAHRSQCKRLIARLRPDPVARERGDPHVPIGSIGEILVVPGKARVS